MGSTIAIVVLIVLVLLIVVRNIYVVQQSKAYVIERLGAFHSVWGVGLHLKEPWIARMELGGDAPRRLRLAAQDAVRALRHPAFAPLRADAAFATLEKNLQAEANHAEN